MTIGKYIDIGNMDELSRLDTPIHRLDARIKTLTTLAFIITVMSFPRYEISALMPFLIYPLAMMTAGNIPPSSIFRKLLIASPFALAVGIFNPLIDRQEMLFIGDLGISGGWISFASIFIRFILTVTAALVLVASTGINRLCAGLDKLGLPHAFTVQLQLLYRYLFVIAGEGLKMKRSAEIRSAGPKRIKMSTYASLIGHLLIRSMDRAGRIYQAMISRGFDGQIRVMQPTCIRFKDVTFLFGWMVFFIVARYLNLSESIGKLFL